ncbi:MAG: hypothetical protein V3S42_03415 [Candidatus Neomarinimicrobiota bacterium]
MYKNLINRMLIFKMVLDNEMLLRSKTFDFGSKLIMRFFIASLARANPWIGGGKTPTMHTDLFELNIII